MSQEIVLNYRTADGTVRTIDARVGDSVMEAAIQNEQFQTQLSADHHRKNGRTYDRHARSSIVGDRNG